MSERPEEKQIHGTWILEKMSTKFPGKKPVSHDEAKGVLIYDANLKTVFARISRQGLLFEYAGHYSFDPDQKNVIYHNLEWATDPKMLERPQMKREFSLSSQLTRVYKSTFWHHSKREETLNITGPSAKFPDAKIVISWKKLEQ